jgi:hypothetical protein
VRNWLPVLTLPLLVVAFSASAQEVLHTDAQQDGLLGPVKSVSTTTTGSPVKWQQPPGPSLVMPLFCRDCTYDPDGTRTTSGQIMDGKFYGDRTELRRDAEGHVTDRVVIGAMTDNMIRHEVMGPFGKTEETDFDPVTGKMQWQQTFSYDQYGHQRDWFTMDGDGQQQSHVVTTRDKDGTLTEQSVWDKNNRLNYQQTYDPEKDTDNFTVWDESGDMTLTRTFSHGKVISFWERPRLPDENGRFGENFTDSDDKGTVENYHCHENGQCDLSRVHYEYLDPVKKRNPTSAEWRDADGKLLYAGYCEYEVDSYGNWVRRKVYVYPSEQGDRALREEDSRTITYWQK